MGHSDLNKNRASLCNMLMLILIVRCHDTCDTRAVFNYGRCMQQQPSNHTTVVCATRFRLIFSVAEHDGRWRVINTSNNNNNSNGLNSILHFAVCYRRMCVCTPRLCLCVCVCVWMPVTQPFINTESSLFLLNCS